MEDSNLQPLLEPQWLYSIAPAIKQEAEEFIFRRPSGYLLPGLAFAHRFPGA